MAIKKVRIKPPGYTDIVHPETSADVVKFSDGSTVEAHKAEDATQAHLPKNVGLGNVDNVKQASKTEFDEHDNDATRHITSLERTKWNTVDNKVDKVTGKGLSTNDYTTAEKNKLSGIQAGAQVNTVTSVAGKTGAVTVSKSDVGLNNVDNVKQATKVEFDEHLADGASHSKTARFVIGTSTSGWTEKDCDYLCDGTNDQEEIIQALNDLPAIGGEIVILDGTYNITASINIPKDNVSIRGSGNATTLKRMWNSSSNEGVITLTSVEDCKIENLQVDGNKTVYTSSSNHGIYLSSSSNNMVIGNTCNNNSNYGIYLSPSSNNTVTSNTCNNNRDGIYLSSSSNNTVTSNTCNNNNRNGIYPSSSSNDNTVTSNTCNNNSYYGIYLSSSSNNTVTGNTCNNNRDGIYLSSSSNNNTVTGNTCNNNSYYGIYLYSSSNDNTVTSNTCNNNNRNGIYLYSSSNDNTVTSNTCNNNRNGIYLSSSSNNNTVTGNTCNNNSNYGIYLSPSSNNNTVTGNTCNNNRNGIYLSSSSNNNTVTGNTCNNNSNYGICLSSSSNNTVTGNTCIRGTGQTSDYAPDQYTIRLQGTANNYNLISSNNCMGKAVVVEGGTGNSAWGNKFDNTDDLP